MSVLRSHMFRKVTDQMGLEVTIPLHPQRIISLVPSQTQLLFDLGLDDKLVGLTRFCIHPANKVVGKTRIGGTKDFNIELIRSLQPDLIIGNKEENYVEGIDELKKYFPVWMSDIYDLNDSCLMITSVGDITGTQDAVARLVAEIHSGFDRLALASGAMPSLSCAYFIWRKPYMVAASGTFIDNMMSLLGVRNAFADMTRYPEISALQIAQKKPDLIFLSSEPYSFTDRHKAEFQNICPEAKIIIVDGELFSWYGSHLRYTPAYFEKLRASFISV